MGARHKLNKTAVQGALIISSLIGLATESWFVCLVAAAVLIALSVSSGDIRLEGRRRRDNSRD